VRNEIVLLLKRIVKLFPDSKTLFRVAKLQDSILSTVSHMELHGDDENTDIYNMVLASLT
jgi:hypothetical protein